MSKLPKSEDCCANACAVNVEKYTAKPPTTAMPAERYNKIIWLYNLIF